MTFKNLVIKSAAVVGAVSVSGAAFGSPTPGTAASSSATTGDTTRISVSIRTASGTRLSARPIAEMRRAAASQDRARLAGVVNRLVPATDVLQPADTQLPPARPGTSTNTNCAAEMNGDNLLDNRDLYMFIDSYFAGNAQADINNNGRVSVQDVLDYVAMFVTGCPVTAQNQEAEEAILTEDRVVAAASKPSALSLDPAKRKANRKR